MTRAQKKKNTTLKCALSAVYARLALKITNKFRVINSSNEF